MTVTTERESLLLRGALDMCVLALLESTPTHAYGIVTRLQDHGFTQTSYGTIYPLVSRLRRLGLVAQDVGAGDGGPARHVLSLTKGGRAALQEWKAQWHEVNHRIGRLLEISA